jgi:Flp pilus assembly protein TadG
MISLLRSLPGARQGMAALELAIVAPVLVFILGGLVTLGNAMMAKEQIATALQTGAELAMLQANSASGTIVNNDLIAAMRGAVDRSIPANAITIDQSHYTSGASSPTTYCVTGTPGNYTYTATASTTKCADSSIPGQFVTLKISYSLTNLFSCLQDARDDEHDHRASHRAGQDDVKMP